MAYPWQKLTPKDKIEIKFSQRITDSNMDVLSLLYKPLIKAPAFSLYVTLKNYQDLTYDKVEFLCSRLLREVDMGLRDFYSARVKLEALGLLTVYKKADADYLYVINPPLAAPVFFQEALLAVQLKDQVGEDLFEEYKSRFLKKANPQSDYTNITKSFFDVFHVSSQKLADFKDEGDYKLADQPDFSSQEEASKTFDWSILKQTLSKQLVAKDFLTEDIKEIINAYHLTYGFDEIEIRDIILRVADLETGEVVKDDLTKALNQAVYKLGKVNQLEPSQVESEESTNQAKKPVHFTDEMAGQVVAVAKTLTPYQYLESIKNQRNGIVSDNEKWLLKDLMDYAKYPTEVINILIHYILVIKKNPSLNKNYMLTIADSWAQKNVKTAEDAVKMIQDFYDQKAQKRKQKQSQKNSYQPFKKGKVESKPDWMTNPEANQEPEMDSSEEQAIRDRLKKLTDRQGES